MIIRHVIDRESDGAIGEVFRKLHDRGFALADGIVKLLDVLEQRPSQCPLWAYESHHHLALSLSAKAGSPYVSVVCTEPEMFTVYALVRRPVAGIARPGDVYYRGLALPEAVDVVLVLLSTKLAEEVFSSARSGEL